MSGVPCFPGIPILPVVVTAGARYDYYGSKDFG